VLRQQKLCLRFVEGKATKPLKCFGPLAMRRGLGAEIFPAFVLLYLQAAFPIFCTRQAAQPREYRNASTCMRCMRPGLICRSDFNRPNFRALYTAKASAFRLDAFRTLAMSSQSMPSALRFELNARCSVSLIRPYETKKVALTNLRPLGKQSEGFSSPFASWTS
jgi:hypothetical protein